LVTVEPNVLRGEVLRADSTSNEPLGDEGSHERREYSNGRQNPWQPIVTTVLQGLLQVKRRGLVRSVRMALSWTRYHGGSGIGRARVVDSISSQGRGVLPR
jgi:hypothetical protein